jgi:hypothetical protein
MTKKLHVAIGIDCDPDRDTYPEELTFRGIENIDRLYELEGIRWTFNIRADTQIRNYHGSADYCCREYHDTWEKAKAAGSALALHLHYFGSDNSQDVSPENILENIRIGTAALENPDIVHMGWTFQSEFSLKHLAEAGVRIDYSPLPRMKFPGKNGVDHYDWSRFDYRPLIWHGVKMIPAFTCRSRLLSVRHRTERVMMTTCTAPVLYRTLIDDFFTSGADFFVSYFHIDEIISALRGWRRYLYSYKNLVSNINYLKKTASRKGYEIEFMNVRELAGVLSFDEYHSGDS